MTIFKIRDKESKGLYEEESAKMKGVRAKKYLGQHFLHDKTIARRIVDSIGTGPCMNLLEVGPGMGILTDFLYMNPELHFIAVEIDAESVGFLKKKYPSIEGQIIQADFLKLNLAEMFPEGVKVIGNFPYNISSQIFFKILEYHEFVPEIAGMLQKEVAERICSGPGSKNYGILSVLLQAFYTTTFLFTVPPQVFSPPPKVHSAVIKLTRNERNILGCDEVLFKKVVKAAFNHRRKILNNSLEVLGVEIPEDFARLRPEQLSVDQFIDLTARIQSNKDDNQPI